MTIHSAYPRTRAGDLRYGVLLLSISGPLGCGPPPLPIKPTAAKVEMVPNESELATLTLSPEAAMRLGITTDSVSRSSVSPHRVFGGEVMIPSGRAIVVSAPVAGVITAASHSAFPSPGANVQAGQSMLMLAPILSPERDVPTPAEQFQMAGAKATLLAAQVTAEGDIDRSRAEIEAAQIALERAKKLFADRAGSQRAVDDAQAQWNIATSVFEAASDRYQQLTKLLASLDSKSAIDLAASLTIRAPIQGVIRSLSVSSGQQVVSGAALFEVLDRQVVWVRVPIFVDLLSTIPFKAHGRVVSLDGKPIVGSTNEGSFASEAISIEAPPTADASSSSADLYFSVDNRTLELRPGQRVGIELPLIGSREAIVVRDTAILYDIYGGTWVYIETEPQRFVRRRVSVRWFDGGNAILQSGPDVGAKVVVTGAAELFGTEFGGGK